MNRPKLEDYQIPKTIINNIKYQKEIKSILFDSNIYNYLRDIYKYCDELEEDNKRKDELLTQQCNKVVYLITKYHLPFEEFKKENNL